MKETKKALKRTISKLQKERTQLQHSAKNETWLDGVEIMQMFHISSSTLARWRKNKAIPFTKLGKKYLYPQSYLNESLLQKIKNAE